LALLKTREKFTTNENVRRAIGQFGLLPFGWSTIVVNIMKKEDTGIQTHHNVSAMEGKSTDGHKEGPDTRTPIC